MYRGFSITPRTFRLRGTGRWTLDVLVGHHARLRAFSGKATFGSEEEAIAECRAFGCRVVDTNVGHCSIQDFVVR